MNGEKNKSLLLYIFYCSNSFNNEEFTRAFSGEGWDEKKIISLPCSGKADLLYFVKAFETGADGLVLITCAKDECRYLEGNVRSLKRAEEVSSLLEEIGMGGGRVAVLTANGNGVGHIVSRITAFSEKLRGIVADTGAGQGADLRGGASG